CRQEMHADLPHGPWAFVFSLTRWAGRSFKGGETLLLRNEVLDFWSDFVSERSVEEEAIIRQVEPKFNRLTVFDPRIPHGVRRVEGTHDPRESRLVIHGWFVQPRPFVEGPLAAPALQSRIDELVGKIGEILGGKIAPAGTLAFGFNVGGDGKVAALRLLSDTTRVPATEEEERKRFVRAVTAAIKALSFPRTHGTSHVTLPLVFER
ncbi:MAG TPA: 2OG-Fe(II) oxygenase, partial [Planctomycetota bacterium]|nr:2OG-Fe(II) oxygenase [Planctomycetota bacterium]